MNQGWCLGKTQAGEESAEATLSLEEFAQQEKDDPSAEPGEKSGEERISELECRRLKQCRQLLQFRRSERFQVRWENSVPCEGSVHESSQEAEEQNQEQPLLPHSLCSDFPQGGDWFQ